MLICKKFWVRGKATGKIIEFLQNNVIKLDCYGLAQSAIDFFAAQVRLSPREIRLVSNYILNTVFGFVKDLCSKFSRASINN